MRQYKCNYKIPNITKDINVSCKEYINKPCPECGENLLTEEDYELSLKVKSIVNWINKWFSWITIFRFKEPRNKVSIKVHKGIKITNVKNSKTIIR